VLFTRGWMATQSALQLSPEQTSLIEHDINFFGKYSAMLQ